MDMKLMDVNLRYFHLTEHRVAVVMSGEDLDWHIVDTDPGTACEGSKIVCPINENNLSKECRSLWKFLSSCKRSMG